MADVEVFKGETTVCLTLNEEEALYVLGVLGHAIGEVPNVYRVLTKALRDAGYDREALYAASDKYTVLA